MPEEAEERPPRPRIKGGKGKGKGKGKGLRPYAQQMEEQLAAGHGESLTGRLPQEEEHGPADIRQWDAEVHIRPAPIPVVRDRTSGMERATAQGWGAEERNYRILTDLGHTSPTPME